MCHVSDVSFMALSHKNYSYVTSSCLKNFFLHKYFQICAKNCALKLNRVFLVLICSFLQLAELFENTCTMHIVQCVMLMFCSNKPNPAAINGKVNGMDGQVSGRACESCYSKSLVKQVQYQSHHVSEKRVKI